MTKKAKHIEDKDVEINQEEERRYRNILHSISALWMYKRQQGEQGILHKADICRVLEKKKNIDESDEQILERFKREKKDVTEIEFLSNSYFGEKNNNLHFQHQSFAEILLAEYYLKVFIVHALDDESDLLEARSKLVLGEPTEQTIEFFKELLGLLRDTVSDKCDNVIEKRKLLYPLFASIATSKNNTLHSKEIKFGWFNGVRIEENSSKINEKLLKNWAIDEEKLEKIMELAKKIIDDDTTLLLTKTQPKSALFDNELTVFQNKRVSDSPTDMDKWLALVVGNLLHNDEPENRKFFNGRLESPENLFEMIRGWNYSMDDSAPAWSKEYFKGILFNSGSNLNFQSQKIINLNFSYSHLKNCNLSSNLGTYCKFDNCILDNIDLKDSFLSGSTFMNIEVINPLDLNFAQIHTYLFFPKELIINLVDKRMNFYTDKHTNNIFVNKVAYSDIFSTLKGLLIFGLKNNLFTIKEIKSWFDYETEEDREAFEKLIDGLEW